MSLALNAAHIGILTPQCLRIFTSLQSYKFAAWTLSKINDRTEKHSFIVPNNYNLITEYEKHTDISKLPDRPKLPLSPVMVYSQKQIKNVPEMKYIEKLRYLAKKYRELNEAEKRPYEAEYKNALDIFRKNLTIYKENLTDEEKEQLIRMQVEKKIKKENLQLQKEKKLELIELGRPKSPGNSFTIFLKEYSDKYENQMVFKEAAKKWASLSEDEKLVYKRSFENLKEKYQADLLTWEKKMAAIGKIRYIRRTSEAIKDC